MFWIREHPWIQWLYRKFVCSRKGHNWKHWLSLGLPACPYCTRCGDIDPEWGFTFESYMWSDKEATGKCGSSPRREGTSV